MKSLRHRIELVVLLIVCGIFMNVLSDALHPAPLQAQAPLNTPATAFRFAAYRAATTGTVVKATPGILHAVNVTSNGPATSFLSIYDHATLTSGTRIAEIDLTAKGSYIYDLYFANGLTFNTTASLSPGEFTIVYR